MPLKFYYDLMSQPCRAVYMFLRLNKIPYEDKPIALRKEQLSKEYAKINPLQLVPTMVEGDFYLTESIAIVDYLCNTRQVADHWYPQSDSKVRARVNEFLHWQHFNTRRHCSQLYQYLLLFPQLTGKPVNWEKVSKKKKEVQMMADNMEKHFLRDTPFISSNIITVSDIFGACEMMQIYALHEENLYENNRLIKDWMERVREETNPVFDESHNIIYKMRDMYRLLAAKLEERGKSVRKG